MIQSKTNAMHNEARLVSPLQGQGQISRDDVKYAVQVACNRESGPILRALVDEITGEALEQITHRPDEDNNQIIATLVQKKLDTIGKTESKTRSFCKALGWRVTGFLITTIVSYIINEYIIQSNHSTSLALGTAALIGAGDFIFKLVLQFFYERLWAGPLSNCCMNKLQVTDQGDDHEMDDRDTINNL